MPMRPDVLVPPLHPLPSLDGLAVHLLGIRGRGMTPLALAAIAAGARVDGCDRAAPPAVDALGAAGIRVAHGHDPSHLADGRRLVATMLARPDLSEVEAAAATGVLHHRADLLAALVRERTTVAVTGSHGKGTVAALVGAALEALGEDPLELLGVATGALPDGYRSGKGPAVVEADDADGTIARVPATVSIVTNSWSDHPMLGRTRGEVFADVERHVAAVPPTGRVVLGRGANLRPLARAARAPVWRLGRDFDVETLAVSIDGRTVRVRDPIDGRPVDAVLAIHGGEIADNAALAFAALRGLGVDADAAARGLGALDRLRRRVELVAEVGGVRVFEDLGKHPASMAASIDALQSAASGRVHVVWEPNLHVDVLRWGRRWSDAVGRADTAIVLPVAFRGALASARTAPDDWLARLGSTAEPARDRDDACTRVVERARPGDVIVVCGVHPDLSELTASIVAALDA